MNITADESVDAQIVFALRAAGHKVLYVAQMAPGISDSEVLDLANTEQCLLLTADKDFGELVFRQRRVMYGVVLIRLAGVSVDRKVSMVVSVFNDRSTELLRAFSVISRAAVRIRPVL